MKYRITEHKNGNDYKYYTVELLRKGILWGEFWKIVGQSNQYKMYVPTKFDSIENARRYIQAQVHSQQVIEEGEL